jgi:protein gp37
MTTKIEWCMNPDGTPGEVWNPVTGCTKVSQGCKNCYAERIAARFWGERKFTDVQVHPERLEQISHWHKPRRIFVNSMSDLFHPDVPESFLDMVFARMFNNPRHAYMILTKRPERMLEYTTHGTFPSGNFEARNIWLGVSVENQQAADERIPPLLQTPAAVRFVSCEPLLGPVDLSKYLVRKNETKVLGRDSVSSREEWRVDDRRVRECLESGCAKGEPLDRRNQPNPMSTTESGTSIGPILPGQSNDQLEESSRTGAQTGLVSLLWEDTRGNDGQPQEREYPGQSTGELGVSDLLRSGDPLDLHAGASEGEEQSRSILWVIAGGESGPGARPAHPDWFRGLRDQCQAAGTPFFFKQWGEWEPKFDSFLNWQYDTDRQDFFNSIQSWTCSSSTFRGEEGKSQSVAYDKDGKATVFEKVGKKDAGRLLDGRTWDEFPKA